MKYKLINNIIPEITAIMDHINDLKIEFEVDENNLKIYTSRNDKIIHEEKIQIQKISKHSYNITKDDETNSYYLNLFIDLNCEMKRYERKTGTKINKSLFYKTRKDAEKNSIIFKNIMQNIK